MNNPLVFLAALLVGAGILFAGAALEMGISHRQPALVTLDSTACVLLPSSVAKSSVADGLCRIEADDLRPTGKLVELWFAKSPGEAFDGQTVTVPIDAIRIAVDRPLMPVPLWITALFYLGVFVIIGSMIVFGFAIRYKPKGEAHN